MLQTFVLNPSLKCLRSDFYFNSTVGFSVSDKQKHDTQQVAMLGGSTTDVIYTEEDM